MIRADQKLRTRRAVLTAAAELVREGHPPSVAAAAERALVSAATAYRYFPSADDLWSEAALEASGFENQMPAIKACIEAAGTDVEARLEALIRSIGWQMIDDPAPFHHFAKAGIASWLAQQDVRADERVPVRAGRRHGFNALVLEPMRGQLPEREIELISAALSVGWGTEAMISLTDVAELDPATAKDLMLKICRWILHGALADAHQRARV
jgi:AcrR family transcriptional regulator